MAKSNAKVVAEKVARAINSFTHKIEQILERHDPAGTDWALDGEILHSIGHLLVDWTDEFGNIADSVCAEERCTISAQIVGYTQALLSRRQRLAEEAAGKTFTVDEDQTLFDVTVRRVRAQIDAQRWPQSLVDESKVTPDDAEMVRTACIIALTEAAAGVADYTDEEAFCDEEDEDYDEEPTCGDG